MPLEALHCNTIRWGGVAVFLGLIKSIFASVEANNDEALIKHTILNFK